MFLVNFDEDYLSLFSDCFCSPKQYIPSIFRTKIIMLIFNLRFQYFCFVLDHLKKTHIKFDILWFFVNKIQYLAVRERLSVHF